MYRNINFANYASNELSELELTALNLNYDISGKLFIYDGLYPLFPSEILNQLFNQNYRLNLNLLMPQSPKINVSTVQNTSRHFLYFQSDSELNPDSNININTLIYLPDYYQEVHKMLLKKTIKYISVMIIRYMIS